MYDSDEDPDRRRDKFARERRDDDRRSGNGYNRYDSGTKRPQPRRDDYQAKRSRPDDNNPDAYEAVPRAGGDAEEAPVVDAIYSGPLLTFKRFLITQDDEISDEDAIKKYNDYKIEYKKHQLERFFRAHKDEEWFRQKYKPEDSKKLKAAQLTNILKRLDVFNELKQNGQFEGYSLDYQNAEKIIRMLDAVVVKLEGGSEDDLKAVLSQKLVDESLADVKKEENETEEKPAEGENEKKETEDGAIDDDGENSSKINIHKTCSVFLRNIPPGVTYEEIEALCKRSPGFLRLALSDGIAERKFYRRGWATFKRDVNIKEICWNLNSVRIRDTDLNGIINKDITRRVRTTNGVSAHKQVAASDLKMAVKLVALCDKRAGLYNASEESEEDREKDIRMGVDLVASSTNPLLKEIRHLVPSDVIEEVSEEEAELLGISNGINGSDKSEEKVKFERNDDILKALDLLIVYLRIVHSVDFYNHGHYSQEDSMPNRCGLIHVRGQQPSGPQITTDEEGNLMLPSKFVQDFETGFHSRVEKGLIEKQYISEEEQIRLGKKDGEAEVEKFILQNTVELAKDKWLCPVSGKKFKGPDFIRKHLQSKHEERLEEVRAEAEYYNNYIADASRPMDSEQKPQMMMTSHNNNGQGGQGGGLLQHPRDRDERNYGRDRGGEDDRGMGGGGGYNNRNSFGGGGGGYDRRGPPRNSMGGGNRGRPSRYFDDNQQQSQMRRDNRPQVSYRDLDAPEDIP